MLAFLLLGMTKLWSQESPTAVGTIVYENHNQVDYAALVLQTVVGKVHDEQQVPIPKAAFALFTEKTHQLVSFTESASDGSFAFGHVAPGLYRLVVKYEGFCSANIPISVTRHARSGGRLDVHMKPASLDSCSYGEISRTH
jgi:hypothetical protein